MKKCISTAALITGVLMFTQVQAATVEERIEALEKKLEDTKGGNLISAAKKKVDVTLYGQVSKAVMFADDGEDDDVFFVDNSISGTRLGVKAKSKLNDEFAVGGKLEFEWTQNASSKVDMDTNSTGDTDNAKKRQMKVYLQSKTAGKLTLGHGSVATDAIAQIDLSGTKLTGRSDAAFGKSFKFYDDNADSYSAIKVGNIFDHLDGGRKDGLRYDSPAFFGVTVSGTVAENNYNDVTVRYANTFAGTKVKAGVGYTYEGSASSTHNKLSGSASVMLPFGLNFTVAAGEKEFDDSTFDDGSYIYGKVGYQMKAFSIGSTSFSVDYGEYDDMDGSDSLTQYEGEMWGVEMLQKFNDINTEFYLAYRLYELDDNVAATDFEDVTVTVAGARFKF